MGGSGFGVPFSCILWFFIQERSCLRKGDTVGIFEGKICQMLCSVLFRACMASNLFKMACLVIDLWGLERAVVSI